MKIILIGANGRMGREIKESIDSSRDEIFCEIDSESAQIFHGGDVVIDFSTCKDREKYINFAIEERMPYACFATGLTQKDRDGFKSLSRIVPVLLCSNASLGFGAMYESVKNALTNIENADVVIEEYHHKKKKDCPSGTALLLGNLFKESGLSYQIQGFRVGNEKGRHTIKFFLEDETIEISHQAFSRKIFAIGAIKLARELLVKTPALYEKYKT